MFYLHPTASTSRFVPTIAGVPESQAKDLDRRRRLDRQLRSFRTTDRVEATRRDVVFTIDRAEPIPA